MSKAKVDIIIPAYNAHSTIEETLESISKQSVINLINIHIIDDHSVQTYDYLIDKFSNLNLFIHRLNKQSGPGVARNTGIDISNSEYIFFLDADDLLVSSEAIEKMIQGMNQGDISIGVTSNERSDGSVVNYYDDDFNVHGKMYSRLYLNKFNIRFPNITRHEDRTFHQLVLASNPKKAFVDDITYLYKYNKKSLTNENGLYEEAKSIEDLFIGMEYLISLCEVNNFSIKLMEQFIFNAIVYAYSLYNMYLNDDVSNHIKNWSINTVNTYKKYEDYLSIEEKDFIYKFITDSYYIDFKVSLNDFLNKKDINILVSFNDAYLDHAILMIKSLKINTHLNINVFLIYQNLSNDSINKFKDFMKEIGTLTLIKYEDDIDLPINIKHISIETYFRLFAPYLIDKNVDRILYLDCDLIINKSIDGFYNMDIEDNIIAGVINFDSDSCLYNDRLKLPHDNPYINAGVLLIDLKKYRDFIDKDTIIKFIENNYKILDYQDQDVLNALFLNKIKLVDIKYNYQITQIIPGHETYDNNIVHYCNKHKPWETDFIDYHKAYDYYKLLHNLNMDKEREELETIHKSYYEKNEYDAKDYDFVLSIIMPIYNCEAYLKRSIDSILNQDLSSFELILINDGSTDNTLSICKDYEEKDTRVKVISVNHVGVSKVRNIGVKEAKAKYITFVDSDDYIEKNIYTKSLDYLKDNNLKMIVYNFYQEFPNGYVDNRNEYNNNEIISGNNMFIEILKDDKIMNFVWSKVIEANILKDISFPDNMVYEDISVSIPIAEKLDRFGFICEPLYHYCRRDGSITTTYSYETIKNGIDINYKQYLYLNNKYPNLEKYNLYNLIKRITTLYVDNYDFINKEKLFNDYKHIFDLVLSKFNNDVDPLYQIFLEPIKLIKQDISKI